MARTGTSEVDEEGAEGSENEIDTDGDEDEVPEKEKVNTSLCLCSSSLLNRMISYWSRVTES
jgi:hypothetical protein